MVVNNLLKQMFISSTNIFLKNVRLLKNDVCLETKLYVVSGEKIAFHSC
jgi:hypothetical protein